MPKAPTAYARYAIYAALATLALKSGAYLLTGSVGLLSDAAESLVNLSAALMAFVILLLARRPADKDHAYGHGKAEYFAGAVEGMLVILAAAGIVAAAVNRFLHPAGLDNLGWGLGVALIASGVNLFTARVLLRGARIHDSITLESDARHLMTDVWTSAGLVLGLAVLLVVPSWQILDPVIACVMAGNIVFTGASLITRSMNGLMDQNLPKHELAAVREAIASHAGSGTEHHKLRTRKAGHERFIEFHLLVPGATSVKASHDLCCDIEARIRDRLANAHVTIHVEPEEESSLQRDEDTDLHCVKRPED